MFRKLSHQYAQCSFRRGYHVICFQKYAFELEKPRAELVRRKLTEVEEKDAIRNFKNPVTGEYIMELYGLPPCRQIGELKEFVKNAILDGRIGNNFEEADGLMREKAAEMGLVPKPSPGPDPDIAL